MGYAQQSILLVDDDPGIVVSVKQALVAQGYEVTTATTGVEALNAFEDKQPDLILLDLMIPECDGTDVCRYIRQHASTPVIVLSVKGSEADVVSVLDLGADDYLIKPFRMGELLARIRAALRRIGRLQASKIICGSLEIDTEQRKVTLGGTVIQLTPIEYALLMQLATNMGRVLTTQLLLQRVWGLQYVDSTEYVKVIVRRLRAKLEPDPAHPRYIITEPHLGYRLNDRL
jgi:two-component system, OmpR family, KDP operon response regulator KdpE